MMAKYEFIAKRLKDIGSNQRRMALHIGVNPVYINQTIKGDREIQLSEIKPIADYLQYDVQDFLDYINNKITYDKIRYSKGNNEENNSSVELILQVIKALDNYLIQKNSNIDTNLKEAIVKIILKKIKRTGEFKEEIVIDTVEDFEVANPELFKVA